MLYVRLAESICVPLLLKCRPSTLKRCLLSQKNNCRQGPNYVNRRWRTARCGGWAACWNALYCGPRRRLGQRWKRCSGIVLQCEKDIKIHFLISIYQHIYIDFISLQMGWNFLIMPSTLVPGKDIPHNQIKSWQRNWLMEVKGACTSLSS